LGDKFVIVIGSQEQLLDDGGLRTAITPLAEGFGVSRAALCTRVKKLGLIRRLVEE
jgi:hypothetical protein